MLALYEIGDKCPQHPRAALITTETIYRYACSSCKAIEEEEIKATKVQFPLIERMKKLFDKEKNN